MRNFPQEEETQEAVEVLLRIMEEDDQPQILEPPAQVNLQEMHEVQITNNIVLLEEPSFLTEEVKTVSRLPVLLPNLDILTITNRVYPLQPLTAISDESVFVNRPALELLRGFKPLSTDGQVFTMNGGSLDQTYMRRGSQIVLQERPVGLFRLNRILAQGINIDGLQIDEPIVLAPGLTQIFHQPASDLHQSFSCSKVWLQVNHLKLLTSITQTNNLINIHTHHVTNCIHQINSIQQLYLLSPSTPVGQLLLSHPLIEALSPAIYHTVHTEHDLHQLIDLVVHQLPQTDKEQLIQQIAISTNDIFTQEYFSEAISFYNVNQQTRNIILTQDSLLLMILKKASTSNMGIIIS